MSRGRKPGSKNKHSNEENAYNWYLTHSAQDELLSLEEFLSNMPKFESGEHKANSMMHWTRSFTALQNGTVSRTEGRKIKNWCIEHKIPDAENINIWQLVFNPSYCTKIKELIRVCLQKE